MRDTERQKEMEKYEDAVVKAWDRISPEDVPEDWDNTEYSWYEGEWKRYEDRLYNRFSREDGTDTKRRLETSAMLMKLSVDVALVLVCTLIVLQTITNSDTIGTATAIVGTVILMLCNHIVTAKISKSEYLRYVAECKVKSQILRQRQVTKKAEA